MNVKRDGCQKETSGRGYFLGFICGQDGGKGIACPPDGPRSFLLEGGIHELDRVDEHD